MRKSIVVHVFVGATALLWLLWYFIPLGNLAKGLVVFFAIVVLMLWFMWHDDYRYEPLAGNVPFSPDFLPRDIQGPIVLVCGDGLDDLFQQQSHRITAQGCWVRVGDAISLTDVVRSIQAQQPRQVGQLSVMYVCLPDRYQDEAVLRAPLKALRQQLKQLKSLTGLALPVVLDCECNGPDSPWLIARGGTPVICPVNGSPQPLADWLRATDNLTLLPVLSQAFAFVCEALLDELEKADPSCPPIHPLSVVLRTRRMFAEEPSVWSCRLYRQTCLQLPHRPVHAEPVSRFPDDVMPLLVPVLTPTPVGQLTRRVILILLLCALVALGFSAANNRDLINRIGADLQRWHAIPMSHYAPKAQALAALQQDMQLLERWQRQGEPMRYGLGYYSGHHLWLALQQTIDTYTPPLGPAPVPTSTPTMIHLDSMSLFEPGKAMLKDGSLNVLVNALVGIKAKPGWLIVISGHTDDTGSVQLNQTLSLQRAEAVRNWMQDTGDMPQSCFAVQGYGDSRPIASNDTPDGRAHNRRVDISLVPQADACRIPGVTPPSPQGGGGSED